ncbi:hypothetical protein GGE65_008438 [Skermanella aerolata]|uniref:hypothetical protein n=1 Tax=Skermanella aerolata TaxID=393310 RepID=UPI003D242BCC
MPTAVHVHLQLRIVGDDGTVFTDSEILRLEKSDHRLEAVGLSISESKSLQRRLQQHVVTAQAATFVDRHRCCPTCGRHLCNKGKYPIVFRSVFGNVALSSPRFYRCGCQPADSQTFSPLTELFTGFRQVSRQNARKTQWVVYYSTLGITTSGNLARNLTKPFRVH